MIKNILFDLDGTLFDFLKAEKIAFFETLDFLNVKPTEELYFRYTKINTEQWKLLEQGKTTREDLKYNRFKILFEEFGLEKPDKKIVAFYENALSKRHFYIDGAEDLLKTLSKDYRLSIVTNGTKTVQHGRLKSADIYGYFFKIYISEEIGFEKPDVRLFEKIFSDIPDFKKEETVIVGDSLTSDIKGGKNSGIKTVWVNLHNQEKPKTDLPDFEINKLSDLVPILKSL